VKKSNLFPRSIVFSFLAFAASILIKFLVKQDTTYDFAWVAASMLALLIPLWSLHHDLRSETNEKIKTILDKIDAAVDPGKVVRIATSIEAASYVVKSMSNANEVWNTYLLTAGTPYNKETAQKVEDAIFDCINRKDTTFRELVSPLGKNRVDNLKQRMKGQTLPRSYLPRAISHDFPVCNFVIMLRHDTPDPIKEDIYFGWGYSIWSPNQDVFWSNDRQLIAYFKGYYHSLMAVSDEYK
jgi:hypothetical protein